MAVSVVQSTALSGGLATNPVFTVSATSTSSLLVVLIGSGQTFPVTNITDNGAGGSNTWTKQADNGSSLRVEIWTTTVAAPKSITTITATNGGADLVNLVFYELSGAANTSPVDKTAVAASNSSGTTASPTNSTGDMALGIVTWFRSDTSTSHNTPTFTPAGAATADLFVNNLGSAANSWSTQSSYLYIPATVAAQAYSVTTVNQLSTFVIAGIILVNAISPPPANRLNNYERFKVGDGLSTSIGGVL